MLPLESLALSQGREKLEGHNLRKTSYLKCLCPSILFFSPQNIQPFQYLLAQCNLVLHIHFRRLYFLNMEMSKFRAEETQSSSHSSSDPAITAHISESLFMSQPVCISQPAAGTGAGAGLCLRGLQAALCCTHPLAAGGIRQLLVIKEPIGSSYLVPLIAPQVWPCLYLELQQ